MRIMEEIIQAYQEGILETMERTKEVVKAIKNIRKENNIPNKTLLLLSVKEEKKVCDNLFHSSIVKKLCFLSEINFVTKDVKGAVSFIVGTTEFYIPLGDKVNTGKELEKLRSQLEYAQGFLSATMKKLDNKQFMQNAPEKVVQTELAKKVETEKKIEILEEQIAKLL